jgi:hypothetical protein
MVKRVTPEIRQEAEQLKADGLSYGQIGKLLGIGSESIRRALDPAFAAKRREQINRARQFRGGDGKRQTNHVQDADRSSVKQDAQARMAEIPPDTRGLTGVLLGDPIPNDPRRPWLRGEAA